MAVLDCGHAPKPGDVTPHTGGYAETNEGKRICYDCAAERDRERARAGLPLSAYVSGDERTITTWPGRKLGTITRIKRIAARRQGNRHIPAMCSVRARIEGREYYGRGQGACMYINLKPVKG